MATVSVTNTTANLSGKTLAVCEQVATVTALWTFNRGASAPFAVAAGATYVANLIAESCAGITTSGGTRVAQIAFLAAQSASSDVNTLDDYEEGSWTPTLIGTGGQSGQAYTTQQGQYVKIGKQVFISGRIVLSTLGTVTTAAAIGGLPFTTDSITYSTAGNVYFFSLTNTKVSMVGLLPASQTRIELFALGAAGTGYAAVVQADLSNTTDLIFSAVYKASA